MRLNAHVDVGLPNTTIDRIVGEAARNSNLLRFVDVAQAFSDLRAPGSVSHGPFPK